MMTLPIFEAKACLAELLSAVEQGEKVVITRHGRPVAKLVAIEPVDDTDVATIAQRKAAVDAVIKARDGRSLARPDPETIVQEGGEPRGARRRPLGGRRTALPASSPFRDGACAAPNAD